MNAHCVPGPFPSPSCLYSCTLSLPCLQMGKPRHKKAGSLELGHTASRLWGCDVNSDRRWPSMLSTLGHLFEWSYHITPLLKLFSGSNHLDYKLKSTPLARSAQPCMAALATLPGLTLLRCPPSSEAPDVMVICLLQVDHAPSLPYFFCLVTSPSPCPAGKFLVRHHVMNRVAPSKETFLAPPGGVKHISLLCFSTLCPQCAHLCVTDLSSSEQSCLLALVCVPTELGLPLHLI